MVKNPLKKIKIAKDKTVEKVSTDDEFVKSSSKKIKTEKLNGSISISSDTNNTNNFDKIQTDLNGVKHQQQHHHHVGHGNLKKRLREESKFIKDVLEFMIFPKISDGQPDSDDEVGDVPEDTKRDMAMRLKKDGATRATSVGDLHERLHKKLEELRGPVKAGKPGKPKLTKAEKKQKKREENRLKAKLSKKSNSASNADFGNKMAQAAAKVGAKPAKPVFNAEGKMVFSKFDFTDDRGFKTDDPSVALAKKPTSDPKSALAKLQKHKEKIKSLEAEGKSEKAQAIEESTAWKTALDRSTGVKVKDDPSLLKRSIKKMERKKKLSKKKWEDRVEHEEKRKHGKQQKRNENLGKRKSDKKDKMKKLAIKKGRIVPGFR